MADLLALVASVLTITSGIVEGVKVDKVFYKASGELRALQNVSDRGLRGNQTRDTNFSIHHFNIFSYRRGPRTSSCY